MGTSALRTCLSAVVAVALAVSSATPAMSHCLCCRMGAAPAAQAESAKPAATHSCCRSKAQAPEETTFAPLVPQGKTCGECCGGKAPLERPQTTLTVSSLEHSVALVPAVALPAPSAADIIAGTFDPHEDVSLSAPPLRVLLCVWRD